MSSPRNRVRRAGRALAVVLAAGLGACVQGGAIATSCPAGTKFAAGACVAACPSGYADRGDVCVLVSQH